jgi:metal-sulfur cluster biosynthetic enzyme
MSGGVNELRGGGVDTAFIWSALKDVMDPEFPISLVDLGLIYDVRLRDHTVEIDLTFTATACPCMEFIHEDIRERLLHEEEIEEVKINQVWDPPWTADRISEEGKAVLKKCGVAA